jgi:hypothetical protein
MTMGRFSIARALGMVALVAFGFAAIRSATDFWLGLTFLLTVGLLCVGALGAALARGGRGIWWLGFAVFGWAYFLAGLVPALSDVARLPSRDLSRQIFLTSNGPPGTPVRSGVRIGPDGRPMSARQGNVSLIGHCVFILIFARVGATVACLLTGGVSWRARPSGESSPLPDS